MTIALKTAAMSIFGLIIIGFAPTAVSAMDNNGTTANVYQHYRCSALVSMNIMTDADALVCDKLAAITEFDLVAWEADNRETSLKLHESVFYEFF